MGTFHNRIEFMLQGCFYKERDERLAWIVHRATGTGVFIFLAIHVLHIWIAGFGPEPFNAVTRFLNHPLAPVLHVFLFFSVLFHAINGLRIVFLDLFPGLWPYQRYSIYVATIVFLIVFIPSTLLILMNAYLP